MSTESPQSAGTEPPETPALESPAAETPESLERPAGQRSLRLGQGLERLWAEMADDYGLFPELSADAALARADRGEMAAATPRLLELLVDHRMDVALAVEVVDRQAERRWPDRPRSLVEEVLDAWWLETLMREPGEHPPAYTPDVVLGVLVSYRAPMVRWFEPWLAELDGHGASHLASMLIDGVDGPAWQGKADEARQVLAWARTETVLNGLVLIGGTHLGADVLSQVLDRLIQ